MQDIFNCGRVPDRQAQMRSCLLRASTASSNHHHLQYLVACAFCAVRVGLARCLSCPDTHPLAARRQLFADAFLYIAPLPLVCPIGPSFLSDHTRCAHETEDMPSPATLSHAAVLLARQGISGDINNVKGTFSSWDSCMSKAYCKCVLFLQAT